VPILNTIGVVLAIISIGFFSIVKTELKSVPDAQTNPNSIELADSLQSISKAIDSNTDLVEKKNNRKKIAAQKIVKTFRRNSTLRKIIGCLCTICSGFFFGVSYNPVIYTSQRDHNPNYFDYWLSFYTGSLATSFVFFIIYCIIKKNKPILDSDIFLPGIASGKCGFSRNSFEINTNYSLFKVGCGLWEMFAIFSQQELYRSQSLCPFQQSDRLYFRLSLVCSFTRK
jgi:hypothetical protein